MSPLTSEDIMECYYCGSTACKAAVTDNRADCIHCSDSAIEYEQGVIAFEDGRNVPADASRDFRNGWVDAASHYGDHHG